ncbi:hypothetical protein M2139_000434 [Enterococcus sp. PF1-24]|uniref:DUF5105 domain-containing protein n=1 Tax=unclassified Enterococcus TaxID=2608891 RepID=UPI0024758EA7|nr:MULTISPECIES: DUF5105 domain-containing protein [unclassified Enterococcus]MDH6363459.1 hypothetical protein [Enterococcus sp. PFB1-1]MDH6400553.1 hypothetical protein [Enterococcus sp. PF1-24]
MKKRWLLPIFLIIGLFAGCQSEPTIGGEEAARLFVNRLVYEKNQEEFVANFVNGEKIAADFDKNAVAFQENFTSQIEALSENLAADDSLALTRTLIEEMDGKTTYTVNEIKEVGQEVTITYDVYGLDFAGIIEGTIYDIAEELEFNNAAMANETFANKKVLSFFEKQVADVTKKKTPITVELILKKKGKQWQVARNQNQQIASLFIAFVAGAANQDELSIEINQVVAEAAQELLAAELKAAEAAEAQAQAAEEPVAEEALAEEIPAEMLPAEAPEANPEAEETPVE